MRLMATFLTQVYTVEITQTFRWLPIPIIVKVPREARETANKKVCGPLPQKSWKPML